MLNYTPITLNFAGRRQTLRAQIRWESVWSAISKALLTCFFLWMLGAMLVLVPFINWTLPAIFLAFGPVLGIAMYFVDRRLVRSLDGAALCPQCQKSFEIHEEGVKSPVYGSCPHCKAPYQLRMPELE